MKKISVVILAVAAVLGMVSISNANLIKFDIAGAPSSSVAITETSSWEYYGTSNVSADLVAGLDDEKFYLSHGQSHTFDFFDITIEASGFLSGGTADVAATLAFDLPNVPGGISGTGDGGWITIGGVLSAGSLTWFDMPKPFTAIGIDDYYFILDFEDLKEIGFGNKTTVSATISAYNTNNTGGTPVPESTTVLLLGIGLIGLTLGSRWSSKNKKSL